MPKNKTDRMLPMAMPALAPVDKVRCLSGGLPTGLLVDVEVACDAGVAPGLSVREVDWDVELVPGPLVDGELDVDTAALVVLSGGGVV
jgi:hypothetical protein